MNISKIITIVLAVAAAAFLVLILSDPYFFTSSRKIQKTGEAKLEEGILGNKAAFRQASHYFSSLIKQGRGNRDTYDLLYWSYRYDDDHAQAEITMTDALEEYPNDVDFLYQRAETRLELQQYAPAISDYNQVIDISKDFPYLPDVYYSRGAAHYKLGQEKEASADLQHALRTSSDSLQPYPVYFQE